MSLTLAADPPERLEAEALGDQIAALAGRMTAMLARWLGLLAEFDARAGWEHLGHASCADWLAWRCSISRTTAREHVRVARRLVDLPLIAEAFGRAELSYSKVRAITRLEHISDEAQVLELARYAAAWQLEHIIRTTRRVSVAEAATAVEDRFVAITYNDDGTASVHARVPAEDAALLARALDHVEALLAPPPGEDDSARPVSAARRADALAWMADHALAADGEREGRTAGDRCEVLVHVDSRVLSGEEPPATDVTTTPRCDLDAGAPIARETARRLCCDAGLVPVVKDGDRTVAVGRRTRSIPPSIRRALRARQPACAFPGCHRRRWLDAHHVQHWADGGRTDLDNLVHLCRHHHRLVHEGGWTVRLRADGTCDVRHPGGQRLVAVPPLPPPQPGDPSDDHGRLLRDGLMPLTDTLKYDLGMAVEGLLAVTTRPVDDADEPAEVAMAA